MFNGCLFNVMDAAGAGANQGMAACVVHARSHVSGAGIGCGCIHHYTVYFVIVAMANRRAGERSLLGPAPLNSRRPMCRAAHLHLLRFCVDCCCSPEDACLPCVPQSQTSALHQRLHAAPLAVRSRFLLYIHLIHNYSIPIPRPCCITAQRRVLRLPPVLAVNAQS